MRILLVKTSSLGDVIHNLPVVNDICRQFPGAQIDWCVEEIFAAIPALHPRVAQVVRVAVRRWRKQIFCRATWREISAVKQTLTGTPYDLVIDSQGLLKSALLARWADGPLSGYDRESAREPIVTPLYDRWFKVPRDLHAVERNRRLVAAALGYELRGEADYGIAVDKPDFAWLPDQAYCVLLTASSRDDKLWPDAHWQALGKSLAERGYLAVLPAGNARERERAVRIAAAIPGAIAAPPMSIPELASLLAGSSACVGVDTGLTHLAVALKVPTIALYTATDPGLTGVLGAGFWRNLGGKAQLPGVDAVLAGLDDAGL